MNSPSISLKPRFDLFRFVFPMTFFPQHVIDKYKNLMDGNQSLFTSPVDYINESIIINETKSNKFLKNPIKKFLKTRKSNKI